ncbi:MAG: SufD family Fe-S cluster assembly protein [Bacilli bacterium]|jgi:Fe-S cluster assembly scaffold protein SufB
MMNKIKIVDNQIVGSHQTPFIINDYDKAPYLNMTKQTLFIYIPANSNINCDLDFDYQTKKQNILVLVDQNSAVSFFEYKTGLKTTGHIEYMVLNNSKIVINRYCATQTVTEKIMFSLNGYQAQVDYYLATITNHDKHYDIKVTHRANATKSNLTCHGISLSGGQLTFNMEGKVNKNSQQTKLNQQSKIMVFNQGEGIINPNLLITDNLVEAKHAAVIGKFDQAVLFYLQSRGINQSTALKLLVKGFLLGIMDIGIDNKYKIIQQIDTYREECYEC